MSATTDKKMIAQKSTGYILALDQGTTSSRTIVFDAELNVVAKAQKPLALFTPEPGYVEQDANEIWQTQISTAQEAIHQAGLLATDITTIGITNQRETTIIWDKATGQAVAPAIVWQDRRTQDWCEKLRQQGHEPRIQALTGLRLDPYFSASKLVWLLNHNPMLRTRAMAGELAFGTVDSWLLYNLTGEHAIDITNASRTLLMNIHTGQWSDELLNLFDIPKALLPKILPSNSHFGDTKTGLFAKPIPIHAVLGDQQAALYGQGCTKPGMAKVTYGTGCFLLMNTGEQIPAVNNELLSTVAWQTQTLSGSSQATDLLPTQTQYALEGSVFMAGAIVQWLRDNLGLINSSHEIEVLAEQVPDSEGVTLIPAFTGLAAPYWRPDATAQLVGMTRSTTKAHVARAALEAIALQVYDVLQAMQRHSPVTLTELRVDGGAANNNLLMQFQADILGVPVLRPTVTEITAKGVAIMAGQAMGLLMDSVIQESWQLERRFEPSMDETKRQVLLKRWQFYLQQSLKVLAT